MVNRRKFLQGCGAAIALPYFESVASASENANPKRMVIVFSPNGMNMKDWNLGYGQGELKELSKTLSVLEGHKEHLRVYSGLAQTKARANGDGGGDHARSMSTFLTGVQIKKTDGKDITAGISADQIAAEHFKNETRIASLQIGCEPGKTVGNCDSGYSCAYSSTISWAGPHQPLPKDNSPRSIFERIYGNGKNRKSRDSSILDFSLDQAKSIMKKLNGADRRKMEEYLNSLREMERRIQLEGKIPKETVGDRETFSSIPETFDSHAKMLMDLTAMALYTDSTRIVTIALANEGSNRPYKEIEVSEGHHELSHHQNDDEKLEKISKIDALHTRQFSYLMDRLKEKGLLDHTVLAYGCGIEDGNSHRHHDLPILVAGGGIKGGRHVVVEKETPLNNLWLGMLAHMGVDIDGKKLGDGTEAIRF